ncbi:MAG: catechol 2,3-dioxygenase [Thermoleophilaceae bacterium]|jgi:catechol 2,3-dioxygenase|nr:catechol 2,3-dioxygenase [Thermoleophilaceae bacterium]
MDTETTTQNDPRSIDAATDVGAVRLTVADVDRAQDFYERAIGLRAVERSGDVARLGAEPGRPLLELVGEPAAPPRPRRSTGLFHLAVLVPSRPELARALRRGVQAGAAFSGASDHLVSEALYLNDPEGNGIEIYRDRPREEWPRVDGTIQMSTEPLDLDGVLSELPDGEDPGMPAGTRMGHVHLQVADLDRAESFYSGILGFDVTVRGYPGALFVSAGGYHHHIGLNTWNSAGAPAPGAGSRGLRRFEVVLPDTDELAAVTGRIVAAGIASEPTDGGVLVADPSGNRVLLRVA